MTPSTLLTPRPLPDRRLAVTAAGTVLALAFPLFLVAGWRLSGWVLGAVLWAGAQLLALVFARAGIGDPSLRGSGVVGLGMLARALLLVVALVAVAASDPELALAGALLYALAYTLELAISLASYLGGAR